MRDKDSRSEAVKELRKKGLELKEKLTQVRQAMQSTVVEGADHPDIPWGALQEAQNSLAALEKPVNEFSEVSKVADLGKLETSPEILNSLKGCLRDLGTLDGFLHDWRDESLGSGLKRMNQAVKLLPVLSSVASKSEKTTISELERIAKDSKSIYSDIKQLLDSEPAPAAQGKAGTVPAEIRYALLQLAPPYGWRRRSLGATRRNPAGRACMPPLTNSRVSRSFHRRL